MSNKNGDEGWSVRQPVDAVTVPHAHLNGAMEHDLWRDIPTLCWAINPRNGQFEVDEVGSRASRPLTNFRGALMARLRSTRDASRQSFQCLEVLSAPDGSRRDVLIIGFPIGSTSTSTANLAGVAIDVTGHKLHVNQSARQANDGELVNAPGITSNASASGESPRSGERTNLPGASGYE